MAMSAPRPPAMCASPPSVRERIRQFYAARPDEELCYADIQIKFGCSYDTAFRAVSELRESGVLEARHVIRMRAKGIAR